LSQQGFTTSSSAASLFVIQKGTHLAYLLLYVDDIILTASSLDVMGDIVAWLRSKFAMTDLGDPSYFLGILVSRSIDGFLLSQQQHAIDLLNPAGMVNRHPTTTPIDARAKHLVNNSDLISDASDYHNILGTLQYLTLTRSELFYAIQQLCLYMHALRERHLTLVKHIFWYIKGTWDFSLHIGNSDPTTLTAYSDANWVGCPDTRAIYIWFLHISW
jgi:hypothetical protein